MVAYGNTANCQRHFESEGRLLVQHVKDYAIILIDIDGRIQTWNDGARNITGYMEEEILGQHISLFYIQDDIEKKIVQRCLSHTVEHGHLEQEGWRKRKDGFLFWANDIFTAIYDTNHQLKGFSRITRDLTDRYTCMQQLSNLVNDKTRALMEVFERITDGFVSLDQNWNYTFVNRAAASILSKKAETLIGKNIWTEFPEMSAYPVYRHFIAAMEEQRTVHLEDYYPFLGLWLSAVLYSSKDGLSIYFQDITAKKKCSLGETFEYCKRILQASRVGIWLVDQNDKTVFMNRKMCEILKYSEQEMVAVENFQFKNETGEAEVFKLADIRSKGTTEKVEVNFVTQSGRKVMANISAHCIHDEKGNYRGAIAMVTDITDKVMLQRELFDEKKSRLKEINRAALKAREKERGEIGKELHDNVNQILSSANLYLKYALAEVADKRPFVIKSLEYISTAIEEIRKFSKRLVGPTGDELMNLKQAIIELTEDIMLVNPIKIHFAAADLKEEQICDALKLALYRIVQELLTNILKHANASIVTITLSQKENQLLFSVKDNGIGFTSTTKRKGIGLTNIKKRVEILNGKIRTVSSPGNGCATKIIFGY